MSEPSVDHETTSERGTEPRRRRWPTRALAAVALVAVGAMVGATTALATHSFSDVPPTNPFHDDIGWLADNGISSGYQDGTFQPESPLSRQAAAAMFRRVAGADPAVAPVVAAGSLDAQTFTAPNTTITGTSSQSATSVLAVDLGGPGTYLLLPAAELNTTHAEARISCYPYDTGVVSYSAFGADLAGAQYRARQTGVWVVDEGAGPLDIRCHKYDVTGSGDATAALVSVVAIKLADT